MWDVTPDFIRFVGDNTLVGFNCVAFDSRFLVRAGRYSHAIIENKYFDVMRYADKFREQLGLDGDKCSLGHLSQKLGVKNPRAHRALADAITTAQVFLKLKDIDKDNAIRVAVIFFIKSILSFKGSPFFVIIGQIVLNVNRKYCTGV